MPKYSWENVHRIVKAISKDAIGMGATVSVKPVHILTPKLWVDFLNAAPGSAHSMWPVYRGLTRYTQEFRNWMVSAGYGCGPNIKEMKPLPRKDFLDKYSDMQKDAEELHKDMIKALDKCETDNIKAILKGDDTEAVKKISKADIPPLPFELRVERVGSGRDDLALDILQADEAKFWLSVAFGAMVLAWKDDEIPARHCDQCDKFFIPYPHAREQRFHSSSCKSTYHTRERRSSNK